MYIFLVVVLTLLLSWVNPLHFPPWVSWHSEAFVFAAFFLLAWKGVFDAVTKNFVANVSFPATTVPLIALALVVWLQFAAGLITFGGDAFVLTLYLLGSVACIVLGRALGSGRSTITALAGTLLLGAFLSSIAAFAQIFDLWEGSTWIARMPQLRRPGGNLGQPNQLATLLLMGVGSSLFLYESKKLSALPSALLALTLLMGVAATESRTGVLSFLILFVWWFAKRKSLNFRLSPQVISIAGGGFLCLFWYWPGLMDVMLQVTDLSASYSSKVNTTVGNRWLVWPQLIEAILQRPWWGWGLGQVSTAQNAVVHAYVSSEPFTYAHNLVLDLAIGVGIPLTAVAVTLTIIWLWWRIRNVRQLSHWYCLAVALPFAVHSMLEFPFAYAYLLMPVMFAIGALGGMTKEGPVFSVGVKPLTAMLLITTGVMAWSVVEYLAIEEDFRVLRFEALRVGKTPDDYQRPKVVLLTQLDALLHGGRIVPKPYMTAEELDLARSVALRFPWPATQNRYALSLALNGNPIEARRQILVMRALHGEATHSAIMQSWKNLADSKYPELYKFLEP